MPGRPPTTPFRLESALGEIPQAARELALSLDAALGVGREDAHLALALRRERLDEDFVEIARKAAGATSSLVYRYGVDTWLVWLTHRDGFATDALAVLRTALTRSGLQVALSEVAHGTDGLGNTGREALQTSRLQDLLGGPACWPTPTCAWRRCSCASQRTHAASSATSCWRSTTTTRLRDTLMIWLATGSHVATAARMTLHEHTVRNRVSQAEELLGHDLTARRTELLVALRLRRMLANGTG